jgi:RNA polymerase sigma factor (sigma-70 family)
MSDPEPEPTEPPPVEPPTVSEADHEKARELVSGYMDEYHQMIFWYVVRRCGAPVEIAEEAMQELWLYSMRQLTVGRREQMFKSYLFWKARNICFDIFRKNNRYVPFGGSPYSMLPEDEAEEKNDAAINEMVTEQYKADRSSRESVMDSRYAEPLSEEAESELFQRFWSLYPDVNLDQEKKEIAFELFRKGLTLKEISEKRGIPISTLSDWKHLIMARVQDAHNNSDTMEVNQ